MSKSFAITLILCNICLIGSAVMDGIDMRKKNATLEATNTSLQAENQSLKVRVSEMEPYISLDLIVDASMNGKKANKAPVQKNSDSVEKKFNDLDKDIQLKK